MAIRIIPAVVLICLLSYNVACDKLATCKNTTRIGDHLYTAEEFLHGDVTQVAFDNDGNFFYVILEIKKYDDIMFRKLYKWKKGAERAEPIETEKNAEPQSIAIDETGRLLIYTYRGIYIYDIAMNKLVPYTNFNAYLLDMSVGPDGTIFVLNGEDSMVYTVGSNTLVPYQNLSSESLIRVDANTNIYVNDENSVYVVQGIEKYALEDLKHNLFYDMAFDSDNNVYGVNERGLWFSYDGMFNFENVLGVDAHAVAVNKDGSIVIVSGGNVIKLRQTDYCFYELFKQRCSHYKHAYGRKR